MSDFDIKFVKCHPEAKTPVKAHDGDAAFDVFATECKRIAPLHREIIGTGIKMSIPKGYYGRIADRSGLAIKSGLTILGGVVDSTYTGEIKVIIHNTNFHLDDLRDFIKPSAYSSLFGQRGSYLINPGDKIAQIIIERCYSPNFVEVDSLENTDRGETGFGASGT